MIVFGMSDIGKKRQNNQDCFTVRELPDGILLAVVCDGMGGANGGAVASKLAIDTFSDRCAAYVRDVFGQQGTTAHLTAGDYTSILAHAVSDANFAVWKRGSEEAALCGMGTTLVAALIVGNDLYCVNVGDSRLYHLTGGFAAQISHDHSLVQHLIDTGKLNRAEAAYYPNRNVITRAIGSEQNVAADIFTVRLSSAGGYILLCTDGLTGAVSTEEISAVVAAEKAGICTEEELRRRVKLLIDLANEAGGNDNVTVLAVGYSA